MTSPSDPPERAPQRHRLIFVSPDAWREVLRRRPDLAGDPVIEAWADRGRPLIARRRTAQDREGVALGLPLPPDRGRRRIAVSVAAAAIVATRPLPRVEEVLAQAPAPWHASLRQVLGLAAELGVEARVFGSLAWQWLTGLVYLRAGSDVDLLIAGVKAGDVTRLTAGLAGLDAAAPMRLDGEVVRPDGAAANWRELHGGAGEVLVKDVNGVGIGSRAGFLAGLSA